MFEAVAGTSEVSIVAQDVDGTVTFWNRHAEEIFGYDADYAVGKKLADHLPLEDLPREQHLLEAVRRGEAIPMLEVTRQPKDGVPVEVSLVVTPVRDSTGRVTGSVRIARDVTLRNRALRELARAEQRLRSIVEAAAVPLALNDAAGNIPYLNSAFTKVFGYTREELPTLEHWWSAAYPDPAYRRFVIDEWRRRLTEAGSSQQPFRALEVVVRCKDGADRTVIANASDLGASLADTHLVSLFDVTELVQARQAIARSERYANLVLASAGDGLCQIDVDGVVTYINPAGAALLGYDPAEVIGEPAHALFHHSRADGSPYPIEACAAHASLSQRTERLSDTDVFWRKDGSSFPVNFASAPMTTGSEHFGVVLTFRDITDEERMRQRLVDNEIKIRKAQEIAGFGSYATDLTTGKWQSSPVLDWIFGIDDTYPHDIPHWNGLLAPEFQRAALDHYMDVAAGRCDFRMDYQIIRPRDGVRRWVAANGELEFDEAGNPSRLIGTIQDIHDRKMIEAEVQRSRDELELRVEQRTHDLALALTQAELAKKSRGDFLAKMSHEIRTPLNAIQGLTYLALNLDASAELRAQLTKIRDSGQHLLSIVNDILDFSKIDAGKMVLEVDDFDLSTALQQVIDLTRVRAQEKGLSLSMHLDPDVPARLRGDALRICQVLLNYLSNAVKFTEHGGVELHVRRAAQADADSTAMLRFEVRDTGIGLTAEQQERLFQSFEQADNSTTRKYGGTGLGLAISRQLVEFMGGDVGVRSQVGRGSTFWFTLSLPLARGAAAVAAPVASVSLAQYRAMLHDKRVLVVDDNEFNLDVATGLLAEVGLTPMVAHDGSEALTRLHDAPFDAVLMDVQMPVLDGLEATRRIREDPKLRALRVIGLTANALSEDRQRYLRAGMDDVLTKPIEPEQLFAVLARWLVEGGSVSSAPAEPAPAAATSPSSESAPPSALWDATTLARYVGDDAAVQRRFIAMYLEGARIQLTELDAAVRAADWEVASAIAHKLKSSSRTTGAMRMGDHCHGIELSARAGDADACRAHHTRLQDCARTTLERVQHHLRDLGGPIDGNPHGPADVEG